MDGAAIPWVERRPIDIGDVAGSRTRLGGPGHGFLARRGHSAQRGVRSEAPIGELSSQQQEHDSVWEARNAHHALRARVLELAEAMGVPTQNAQRTGNLCPASSSVHALAGDTQELPSLDFTLEIVTRLSRSLYFRSLCCASA